METVKQALASVSSADHKCEQDGDASTHLPTTSTSASAELSNLDGASNTETTSKSTNPVGDTNQLEGAGSTTTKAAHIQQVTPPAETSSVQSPFPSVAVSGSADPTSVVESGVSPVPNIPVFAPESTIASLANDKSEDESNRQAVTPPTPPQSAEPRTGSHNDKTAMHNEKPAAEATEASSSGEPAVIAPTSTTGSVHAALDGEEHRHGAAIEADADLEDESLGSEPSFSGTTSLSSSVRDYTFENNRRYHKYQEGKYHFPNDEPEQEREDMKHAMVVHMCGGRLTSVPLTNPQRALDIGTGTGIWAIDMGDEYPSAEIIGIDLSPIQPSWVPPNVRFVVDDLEQDWVYPDNHFDLIHIRNMTTSIKDWSRVMEQALRCLKPGGWVDSQEMRWSYGCDDGTMTDKYTPPQMIQNIYDGLEKLGINMNSADAIPGHIAAAGFDNVQSTRQKVPVGTWPKDRNLKNVGVYCRSVIYDGLQAITLGPYTRGLGWTKNQVEVFLVQVRKDLLDSSVHSYVFLHSAFGQKPLVG